MSFPIQSHNQIWSNQWQNIIFVVEIADEDIRFYCSGGPLGRDGCIYSVTCDNSILKIGDTTNHSHYFVGNTAESDHGQYGRGWGDAILGIDGCIYWPPQNVHCILKYDLHTNQASLVGDVYGNTQNKWRVGSLYPSHWWRKNSLHWSMERIMYDCEE